MHTRRKRVRTGGEGLKEPLCSADPVAASFFPTNFVESLVHCRSVFRREILASFSFILFVFLFFRSSLARFFIRSSRLSFSFVQCLFSFSVSNHYELTVHAYPAFNKIKLSLCGWIFQDNSLCESIVQYILKIFSTTPTTNFCDLTNLKTNFLI